MAEKVQRGKPIPEEKKNLVVEIAKKIKESRTVLLASTKGLPASQFQKIKKSLRGKAEIIVAKKSIIVRAISTIEKGALQNLKKEIAADVALIFSKMEAFELASVLAENQSSAKAKAGDAAPHDIEVEPGPTELIPGPAISELGSVGLKIAVENGKLSIKQGATIVKEGEIIKANVASVMGKLNIFPMKVGFIPLAAYDSESDVVYTEIKIDKEGTLLELKDAVGKALGFAINLGYTVKETVKYFISKAGAEEKALENRLGGKKIEVEGEKNE
ncbi:MAG: 50S ribosomal protein L10 [Nanoarchaeota archaeon]|nr:50S ribosomal protein L10 [Nanoarchaeota archaeon]MBU1104083.1 50S ribosomal protein L10 [Nanoarchaeota archaeon]